MIGHCLLLLTCSVPDPAAPSLAYGPPAVQQAAPAVRPVMRVPSARTRYGAGRAPAHAGAGGTTRGADRDRWLAEDKLKHFFMSYAVTGLAFGAARTAGWSRDDALPAAAIVAAVAGLGKEFVDTRSGAGWSMRDLVWDGAGIAAAWALLARTR